MKHKLIVLGILFLLSACGYVVDYNLRLTPAATPVPTPTIDKMATVEAFESAEQLTEPVVKVEEPGLGITFYQGNLNNLDWLHDNQTLVGTYPRPFAEDVYDEVYIWTPEEGSYTKLSSGMFGGFKANISVNPIFDQVLYWHYAEFRRPSNPPTGLYVANLDPIGEQYLGDIGLGDWMPDGESVLTEHFEIINLRTGEVSQLPGIEYIYWLVYAFKVSPDGRFIAFSASVESDKSTRNLYLFSIESETITNLGGEFYPWELVWSPDGSWLVIASANDYVAYDIQNECFTDSLSLPFGLEDHTIRSVGFNFAWSPDGNTIAISGLLGEMRGIFFIDVYSDVIQNWLNSGSCERQ